MKALITLIVSSLFADLYPRLSVVFPVKRAILVMT